ncbi:MAG: cellulose biosynthesis cyclic di-GMP-binding regulatory protein BcsB [Cyanothece sp. SIO2G6]|nr:cellulose biosynthesis cyclic di-GMP-binding regulatory protein BcsB [Cyanothece sp. SIO2G6]
MLFLHQLYQYCQRHWRKYRTIVVVAGIVGIGISIFLSHHQVRAQDTLQQQENQLIQQYSLPQPSSPAPVYQPRPRRSTPAPRPAPASSPATPAPAAPAPAPASTPEPESPPEPVINTYVMDFNRSPVVGYRLRLEGVYPETRLGITRPQSWDVKAMKVVLRFQHSPSLVPERSNLTLRVNETSVGSVWLNQPNSEIAEAVFDVPPSLIQDYNELSIVLQQNTSAVCTNPEDPTLWTEILPDSKVVMDYTFNATPLDFNRYPYPFIDPLNLNANAIAYLTPTTYSDSWLTAVSQLQASLGRLAEPRLLNTRLVQDLDELEWGEGLMVVGQPGNQPLLSELTLPFEIENNQILDGEGNPMPGTVGMLALATLQDGAVPVLVATGNGDEGISKAVRSLVQPENRNIETGQVLVVDRVSSLQSPLPRRWPGFVPTDRDTFQLAELTDVNGNLFTDITVNGTEAPGIQIPFKSLPDEVFHRGSTMVLEYNYSAQVNGRLSAVEVSLNNIAIASKRLDSWGRGRKRFKLDLPPQLLTPNTVLTVRFLLRPRDSQVCGPEVDQQLTGTLHSTTLFNLSRDISVALPDLALLRTGFPLTDPQDLSGMAMVLPDNPASVDVETMLAVSKRLGNLSDAASVQFEVYRASSLPNTVRQQKNLVAIGLRDRFPLPATLTSDGGSFGLQAGFTRIWQGNQIQAFPDTGGMIKAAISDQSDDHIILALSAQTTAGLADVRDTFDRDPLFSQLQGDTFLISRKEPNPSPYNASGYTTQSLQQSPQRRIQQASSLSALSFFLQRYWFLIPTVLVLLALLLYGISQIYLNRLHET